MGIGLLPADNANVEAVRCLVVEVAAEVAFRRWLGEKNIPFAQVQATPFSQPLKGELLLNGRGCHLVNTLLPPPIHSHLEGSHLADLLSAPVCLAEEQLSSDRLGHADLLVFTFTGILPEMSWHARRRTPAANQDIFLIYILPQVWQSLSPPITLVNHSPQALDLELGGSSHERGYLYHAMHLPPGHPVQIEQSLARLSFLTIRQIPIGTITIQGAGGKPHEIPARAWANQWVHGSTVLLAGSCSVGEFRRRARRLHRPDPPWSRLRLPARGMAITVEDLSPMANIISG